MMGLEYGIDLGNRAIKVVAGRKKGPVFEVHRAFSIPVALEGDPEESLLAAVRELKEALGKAPGSRYTVSGKDLIIRYTKVPKVPLWRLERLMEFEVKEMSEQAGSSLACGYNIINLGLGEDVEETVLVAVVKEHFLAARQQALAEAVGEPEAGMPGSIALFNSYLHSGDLHEDEYVFLVDIGDRNVEFVLQKDGEVLFARNISAGGRGLTEAVAQTFGVSLEQAEGIKEEYGNVTPKSKASYASSKEEKVANALMGPAGQLSSMIQSSLAFSRAQTGIRDLSVGRILLSGGGANLRGLDAYLASTFGCTVERFLPESGLDLTPLDGEEAAEFERDPGRFAVALGLAVSGVNKNAFLIDLVPAAIRKKREFVGRTLFMWASAAAAVLFLVMSWVGLSGEAEDLKLQSLREGRKASKARREREEYLREMDRRRDLRVKLGALNRLTHPAFAQARAVRLVQAACPPDVWIERIATRRINVPVDPARPRGPKRARTMVQVTGEIQSIRQDAEDALAHLIRGIQAADERCRVTIEDKTRGRAKLSFRLQLDFFAPAAEGEAN